MSYNSSQIVLDPGSGFCKGGFSHEVSPRVVIPSVVMERCPLLSCLLMKNKFARPMQKGIVTDWDLMEKLYTRLLYNDLNLNGQVKLYSGMIVVENMCNTKRAREKTAELMFDKFGVNSLCMYSAPLLSLLASSNLYKRHVFTGVVLELGYTNSFIVPVDNFTVHSGAWGQIAYGGRHITDYLSELLSHRSGNSFDSETVESTKLSHAYVASSYVAHNLAYDPMQHSVCLPNGQMIGRERYECTEPLFMEKAFDLPQNTVTLTEKACNISALKYKKLIAQKKMRKMDILENLCSNIVVSGGTSAIPGLCTRLQSELVSRGLSNAIVPLPVAEKYGAWKGAAKMANMDAFRHLWVGRAEFEDGGVQIVHRKWPPVNTVN